MQVCTLSLQKEQNCRLLRRHPHKCLQITNSNAPGLILIFRLSGWASTILVPDLLPLIPGLSGPTGDATATGPLVLRLLPLESSVLDEAPALLLNAPAGVSPQSSMGFEIQNIGSLYCTPRSS